MPICTREGFETSPKNPNEIFNDNELVFYCETTKQIFREYEDYFRHVMLINSTIWQCEETGKENLTYAEALYSEKKARKKIETFKDILRAPTLIAIARASQSSFKEINNIVYNLLRDRFFRGELIQASISTSANTYHECRVIDIIKPNDAQDNQVIDPNKVTYKLQKTTGTQLDAIFAVPPQNIRRNRSDFSQGNLQLFIKDSVHRVQGIIKPKPEHFKKYVTDKNVNWSKLFVGSLPEWIPAKPKKEPSIKKSEKLKKDDENGLKDKKQSSISKYVVKSDEIDPEEKLKKEQSLKEQMERLRKEKEEKAAEIERKRMELLAKVESEVNRIMVRGDDLEREDQKLMPKYRPIHSLVPIKYFGDLLYCKEFLHSYVGILTLTEAFKPHITFHEITRAFTCREVAGPLSDILICLLGSIFSLQGEEEEEQSVEYQKPKNNLENEPFISIRNATETHFYVKKAFQQKLNDLPVDSQTLSEVLRLHLLASGAGIDEKAERWRFMYRNGYSIMEDPGLDLRMSQPHILRALRYYTVYQLPISDILKIVNCLISQIMTYSSTLNVIDERMENIVKARSKIRLLLANENKRLSNITSEKKKLQQQFQLECFEQKDNLEFQAQKQTKQEELHKQIESIDAKALKEKQKFDIELSNEYSSIFNFMVYLGSDRAYRKYYVLESIAGIFIEHPTECNDHCLKNPPKNSHLLLNAPKNKKDLRTFLTQHYNKIEKEQNLKTCIAKSVKKEVNDLEADKENLENLPNGKINGLPNGEVKLGLTSEPTTGSTTQLTNGDIKLENEEQKEPTQYELYMCTGNSKHCIVHDEKNPDRVRWSYLYTEEEFDALVDCLNSLADRESYLKDQLITYKPFLIKHIKKCPIDYLNLEEDSTRLARFKTQMINETNRKYANSNFGMPVNSDLNEVMYNALVEKIMQLEVDITTGCLGKMKVNNISKWREDLADKKYEPQVELIWGPDDSLCKKAGDPGDSLGDTMEIESEDSSDESICNYESPELKNLVTNLASALLQIGQSIEQKFFKAPFGLQKEIRDKEERKIQLDKATLKLKHWERSLMNAASYSSVFLHLNVLHDSIRWNRSTNRSNCIICRRRGDAEKLLLCDECNAGTHMFCLKPKLKKIPEGNWYCKRCVTTYGFKNVFDEETKKRGRKRKQFMPQVNDYEDDDSKSNSSRGSKKISKSKRNYDSEDDEDFIPEKDRKQKKIDDLFKKNKRGVQYVSENEENEEEVDNSTDEVENENETDDENRDIEENTKDLEEDSEESDDDVESEENEENQEEDEEEACHICSYDGIEITCGGCSKQFHLDCIGLKRNPRGQWKCTKCKEKDDKKKKIQEEVYESDSVESSSDDEPLVKRQKRNTTEKNKKSQNNTNNILRSSTRNSGKVNKDEDTKQTRRGRRTGENLPLNSVVLYDLLDDISKNENSWPFLRPVLQSEVPDYYEIIKRPMDFAKIKSKLNMGHYRINEEVLNDIQLVFKNCDAYNTEGNEIYVAGATLERFIMARCKDLNLPFKPSDMNTL
ncbi:bromodomain adjacent to zinc finger domain protein 1A [Condylostylus longicornis]|uniref:bromodomain adjacent to zinc finger domain protein 1A n=1 Tax=Condylostylus longicornis TaxID=2530218 RepID=UPI00244DDFA2|nr:bromodomain adjacent to zinc finger domain protein 1A [Condylostylus longicornis]